MILNTIIRPITRFRERKRMEKIERSVDKDIDFGRFNAARFTRGNRAARIAYVNSEYADAERRHDLLLALTSCDALEREVSKAFCETLLGRDPGFRVTLECDRWRAKAKATFDRLCRSILHKWKILRSKSSDRGRLREDHRRNEQWWRADASDRKCTLVSRATRGNQQARIAYANSQPKYLHGLHTLLAELDWIDEREESDAEDFAKEYLGA
jgi:hypothetical protein